MNNDLNSIRLARLNGIDPQSKAWQRWCGFIGQAGVEKAIIAARNGTGVAPGISILEFPSNSATSCCMENVLGLTAENPEK